MSEDPTFEFHECPGSSTLLVCFGGIAQGFGIPPFEFRRVTTGLGVHRGFIRDRSQSWYSGSLPGVGSGIADLAGFVRRTMDQLGADRLVCIGNSMGGYAALLVGSHAGAHRVLSFAPQTFVRRRHRLWYRDDRWSEQMARTRGNGETVDNAFDLKRALRSPGFEHARVFADPSHRLDRAHARRLARVSRVELCWRPGGHQMVRTMLESGELERVLREACELPSEGNIA